MFPRGTPLQLNTVKQRPQSEVREVTVVVVILGRVFLSLAIPTFAQRPCPSSETAAIKVYCQSSSALSRTSHLMHLGQMTGDCDLRKSYFLFKLLLKRQ